MEHLRAKQRGSNRRRSSIWAAGATLLLLAAWPATGRGTEPAASPRLVPSASAELTEYRGFRRMHARSDRFDQEAWLDAWTELDATGFRFRILSERGSEHIRNKVLRAVLKREQEIVAEGMHRAALTDANYVFTEPGEEADGVRYVRMKPKRKDVVLVDGRMVLSPDGNDLLRIEGRLARNPSFWTSLVNVVRHFATVDGVRVPTSTESQAQLKLAGRSTMQVIYEYESINGRPVTVSSRRQLASAARPRQQ